mgnify:CR=1 FL=1
MNELETLQMDKLRAEISQLAAQSDKLMMETRWYPVVVVGTLVGAIIALTKIFL